MAEFVTKEIAGWLPALKGMRGPLKSYDRNDSYEDEFGIVIGPNDYDLLKRLTQAGPEHCKALRQIYVWVEITANRAWWQEWATYRIGVDTNSESTMHRIIKDGIAANEIDFPWFEDPILDQSMINVVNAVNKTIRRYKQTEDKEMKEILFQAIKSLLPEGYMQTRYISVSYAALRNMYHQRKNHRLPSWNKDFVSWVHTLPYSEFITGEWPAL